MNKKRKKKKLRVKKSFFIFLIIVILFLAFLFYFNHPKNKFYKYIDNSADITQKTYNEIINKYATFLDDDYSVNIEQKLNYNDNLVNLTGDVYYKDNMIYLSLNRDKNNLKAFNRDNKLYFKIQDSYYYTNYENLKMNYKNYIDFLKNNTYKKDYTKTNETININNDKFKTKKYSLKINNDTLIKFFNNFNISNSFTDQIKDNKYNCVLSVYVYKNNPIVTELEIDSKENISFQLFNYKNHLRITYINNKKNSYIDFNNNKIDLYVDSLFKGKGTYKDNIFNIEFMNLKNNSIGTLKYTLKDKKINLELSTNLDSLKLNYTLTIEEINKTMPSVDISKSKDVKDISKKDIELIRDFFDI